MPSFHLFQMLTGDAMGNPNLSFESFDGRLRQAAEDALTSLESPGRKRVSVDLDPQLASVLARFLATALERGGVAYGPLGTELSPNQAGKILGLSRPLVVRRMEDGRLPFHYVGTHRRGTLGDVLQLKAGEDEKNSLMADIYRDFEEIGDLEPKTSP
jgi:excisionase family DNA binding protein